VEVINTAQLNRTNSIDSRNTADCDTSSQPINFNIGNDDSDSEGEADNISEQSFRNAIVKDIEGRRDFLLSPTKKNIKWRRFYVDRVRDGGITRMARKYALFLEDTTFLALCEKKSSMGSANYVICMSAKNISKQSEFYLGNIRSNFIGSNFIAYDDGADPKKSRGICREELCDISFLSGIHAPKDGRKKRIRMVTPKLDGSTRPLSHSDSLSSLYKSSSSQDIRGESKLVTAFENNHGIWDARERCFLIDWENERIPQPSRRNCQFFSAEDPSCNVLQFGKLNPKRFFLDVAYPLSPYQGFALAVSQLDYKICTQ